jgi:hypothetical protein
MKGERTTTTIRNGLFAACVDTNALIFEAGCPRAAAASAAARRRGTVKLPWCEIPTLARPSHTIILEVVSKPVTSSVKPASRQTYALRTKKIERRIA